MSAPQWLGPPVRTYRPRIPGYDIVYLSLMPACLLVGTLFMADPEERWLFGGLTLLFALLSAGWLTWSASAVLTLHRHGVRVGRRLGRVRSIPYGSIHPASIATYADISRIVNSARPLVWPRWFIFVNSKEAVSFVGPARASVVGPGQPPPPVAGDGFVLFATPDADVVADELRRALLAHGVPREQAYASAGRSPVDLAGVLLTTRRQAMPGYDSGWRPDAP